MIDYLAENYDNPVISKIKNLEQLTTEDLDELEHILWNQLGTKGDYQKTTSTPNLAYLSEASWDWSKRQSMKNLANI